MVAAWLEQQREKQNYLYRYEDGYVGVASDAFSELEPILRKSSEGRGGRCACLLESIRVF